MKLDGSRIVLTGAASGIGRSLLMALAAHDAQIVAADRDADGLAAALATLPAAVRARVTSCVVDLGEAAGNDALFATAVEAMGGIDLFIANAGFAYYEVFGAAEDVWARLDAIYRVNVFAPLYALAKMRASNGERAYAVVMTASAQAKIPVPGYAVYASTKAALDAFRSAYQHEAPRNETLMLVYPVSTRTNFFRTASAKAAPVFPPSQTPDEVARAIVRGILRDQRHIYPSRLFSLIWMLNRVLPFKWASQAVGAWQLRRWRDLTP
jgi:uncharacterized protein